MGIYLGSPFLLILSSAASFACSVFGTLIGRRMSGFHGWVRNAGQPVV
jgi:hypothetical protein